jgi:hypothetical protein
MTIAILLLAMSLYVVQRYNWSSIFKKVIAVIGAGTVVTGVDQGIEMITDGNQQVTGSTVININSPKKGIVSDEHNYLIIDVAVGVGILVIMICAICICLFFRKK